MKRVKLLIIFTMVTQYCVSQSLEQSIKLISTDLAAKVSKKGRIHLALADFVNSNGRTDALTEYIHEQVETGLINADNLQVMDRSHIKQLLNEHHLQSQGLIDESTAKSSISFIKVDGWVLGEIVHIGNQIKIKLKVIDINTSQIFAASTSDMIDDETTTTILQPKLCPDCGGSGLVKSYTTCKACQGKGGSTCYSCGGVGNPYNGLTGKSEPCQFCGGKGKIACSVCGGRGQMVTQNACVKCKGSGRLYD